VTNPQNRAAVWFGRVVWLGVVANMALAIPTVLVPEVMLRLTGLPQATPLLWTRFAAWLLILLSLLYIPGARDPYRYRATAWLSVAARLAGVLFFLTQPSEYRMFGLFDGVFLVPEAILLTAAMRGAPAQWAPAREGSFSS
jgi:hypothetical protein